MLKKVGEYKYEVQKKCTKCGNETYARKRYKNHYGSTEAWKEIDTTGEDSLHDIENICLCEDFRWMVLGLLNDEYGECEIEPIRIIRIMENSKIYGISKVMDKTSTDYKVISSFFTEVRRIADKLKGEVV